MGILMVYYLTTPDTITEQSQWGDCMAAVYAANNAIVT